MFCFIISHPYTFEQKNKAPNIYENGAFKDNEEEKNSC